MKKLLVVLVLVLISSQGFAKLCTPQFFYEEGATGTRIMTCTNGKQYYLMGYLQCANPSANKWSFAITVEKTNDFGLMALRTQIALSMVTQIKRYVYSNQKIRIGQHGCINRVNNKMTEFVGSIYTKPRSR